MSDLEKAIQILNECKYTLVLVNGNNIETDTLRGVHPLLNRYGKDYSAYSAADKVIGKGAALLYVLLKIKIVHTNIISEPALKVFKDNNIDIKYETLVPNIFNHFNTGFCPIEAVTKNIDNPIEALEVIKKKLKELGE